MAVLVSCLDQSYRGLTGGATKPKVAPAASRRNHRVMARASRLKVFRTSIGFHDAYVAAPSRKAALEAWGSEKNLFALGAAELVDDEALTAEPLATPGVVIKRLRGTTEQQIAALPPDPPRPKPKAEREQSRVRKPEPKKPKSPRPSRTALNAAEEALAEAERRYREQLADLKRREQALARERQAAEADYASQREELEDVRKTADAAYSKALSAWQAN